MEFMAKTAMLCRVQYVDSVYSEPFSVKEKVVLVDDVGVVGKVG